MRILGKFLEAIGWKGKWEKLPAFVPDIIFASPDGRGRVVVAQLQWLVDQVIKEAHGISGYCVACFKTNRYDFCIKVADGETAVNATPKDLFTEIVNNRNLRPTFETSDGAVFIGFSGKKAPDLISAAVEKWQQKREQIYDDSVLTEPEVLNSLLLHD